MNLSIIISPGIRNLHIGKSKLNLLVTSKLDRNVLAYNILPRIGSNLTRDYESAAVNLPGRAMLMVSPLELPAPCSLSIKSAVHPSGHSQLIVEADKPFLSIELRIKNNQAL